MSKLYLGAIVPNEGARRLAQWLMARELARPGARERLAVRIGSDAGQIDRVIAGEVVPGELLAHALGSSTSGAIDRRHWRQAAHGGWFDPAVPMRAAA